MRERDATQFSTTKDHYVDWLGHSSIQLTLDTYTHVVEGLQERASERLEQLLANPTRVQTL